MRFLGMMFSLSILFVLTIIINVGACEKCKTLNDYTKNHPSPPSGTRYKNLLLMTLMPSLEISITIWKILFRVFPIRIIGP